MKAGLVFAVLGLNAVSLGAVSANPPEKPRDVYAAWYDVPANSLAQRRAAPNELTAAHNRLPLGTLVRLTNPHNDHTVVVRITDRGIPHAGASIDICKEAARSLGFLREGVVRVHMEVLPKTPPATAAAAATPRELVH